jgi:hypothetical protein
LFALEVLKAGELALLLVVGKLIVASHARVALFQTADGFINLGSCPQSTQRDTLSQLFSVGQKADLLPLADSAVFLGPAFAPAQGESSYNWKNRLRCTLMTCNANSGEVLLTVPCFLIPLESAINKEQVMPFFCPECGQKLKDNYSIVRNISNEDHGKPLNCEGIGQKGVYGHEQSKKQQQVQARVAAVAVSAHHRQEKSVSNLNKYQTRHKNDSVQQGREERAKTLDFINSSAAEIVNSNV